MARPRYPEDFTFFPFGIPFNQGIELLNEDSVRALVESCPHPGYISRGDVRVDFLPSGEVRVWRLEAISRYKSIPEEF